MYGIELFPDALDICFYFTIFFYFLQALFENLCMKFAQKFKYFLSASSNCCMSCKLSEIFASNATEYGWQS